MIICTKTADAICKQAFNKNNVAISKLESIIDSLKLDSTLQKPEKEAFIITSDDVRNIKNKNKFLDACKSKHPNVHVVFIAKSAKLAINDGEGIDKVLVKPKAKVLADAVYGLVQEIANKIAITSSADQVPEGIEEFKPPEVEELESKLNEESVEELPSVGIEEDLEEIYLDSKDLNLELDKEEEQPLVENNLTKRIKQCSQVADVSILSREISASRVIKDIIKDNQEYAVIEDKLKAIQEKIYSIMADSSISSLEEKLDKVRALLYDKEYYRAKNNTVIEQRVEEIIKTVTTHTCKLLSSRLKELDNAIVQVYGKQDIRELNFTRLAGITDERANLILELAVLDKEVRSIQYATDSTAHEIAARVAESDADLTGNPLVNAHLRVRGDAVISKESLDSIVDILSTATQSSEEFREALRSIEVMRKKLNKLFDLDKETIAAQTQIINFLRSSKIEDTIVAETLIKKSLRVFIGCEGTGRTVVPYVLSKLKSRQNANVLYIDITGKSKLKDYGYEAHSINDWLDNRYEKEFCVVEGHVNNTPESAQRLLVSMVKAADYYKVINVVMSPEQTELFNIIADDVLCVNYIVDTNKSTLDFMKTFITDTKRDNVAQRIVINKCSVPSTPIIERLGLLDVLDVNVVKIPYINQLVDCSLNEIAPYELAVVQEGFREAAKYA